MSKESDKVRAPGEVSGERVQRALAMAAGDVLQRSKLPPDQRMKLAADISDLAKAFEEMFAGAWA